MIDPEAAAALVAPYVRRTPTLALGGVVLKLEHMQVAGSFKARGAFHKLLASAPLPAAGVATASGGNHGIAVAFAARALGVAAEVFVFANTSGAKRALLEALGANVTMGGESYAAADVACRAHVATTGALYVPAFDDELVVAGAAGVARELEEQAQLDTLLVAVGGGGLIAGCAAWYRGRVKVVGVETEGTPTLHAALAAGKPVDVEVSGAAADALGARRIGAVPFSVLDGVVTQSVLVTDAALRKAQRELWEGARVAAELAASAGLAALRTGAYVPAQGERVGVLVCGGNLDPTTLA